MTDAELSFEVRRELHALGLFKNHLKALHDAFEDPEISEICVNRHDDIWIERGGTMTRLEGVVLPGIAVRSAVKTLASANHKDVHAVLDCRMPGVRVAAALEPVAIKGSALCIRKHARSGRRLEDYVRSGGFDCTDLEEVGPDDDPPPLERIRRGGSAVMEFLQWVIRQKKNVIVAGSTGSGKTTLLNAMLAEVPHSDRVLTIEDTAELKVVTPNHVGLEASPEMGITIRSLVKLALRFRPDRIWVGEVRGAEAYDLLDAMNTGHSGGCSIHADSARLALSRLESCVRMNPDAATLPLPALRQQIADSIRYVIYCARRGPRRGPEQILEVLGIGDDGNYRTRILFDVRGRYES